MENSNNTNKTSESVVNISDVRSSDIKCTFCGHIAIYETLTNNNYLCDDNDCKLQYVDEIIRELK
jgi:hypothetical protein